MQQKLNFNKTQVKTFENLLKSNCFEDLPLKETFKIYNKKGIGVIRNKLITYSQKDIEIIKYNIDIFYQTTSRGIAQKFGGNEKSSINKKVHKNEILITAFNQLKINKKIYNLPSNSGLLINFEEIKSIEHKKILIIENYEVFINISKFSNIDEDYLIIYRGENTINVKCPMEFVKKYNMVVDVFPDYDFYGLTIARSYHNFGDIFIPPNINVDSLSNLFENYGNKTMCLNQRREEKYIPNKHNYNCIIDLINSHNSILLQEVMLTTVLK